MNRLESVTKRLEQVPIHSAVATQDTAVQTSTPSPKRAASAKPAATAGNSEGEFPAAPQTARSKPETDPNQPASMSIAGYNNLLAGPVKEYLQLSQKISGDVAAQSKLVEDAFLLVTPHIDDIIEEKKKREA